MANSPVHRTMRHNSPVFLRLAAAFAVATISLAIARDLTFIVTSDSHYITDDQAVSANAAGDRGAAAHHTPVLRGPPAATGASGVSDRLQNTIADVLGRRVM